MQLSVYQVVLSVPSSGHGKRCAAECRAGCVPPSLSYFISFSARSCDSLYYRESLFL